MAIAYIKKLKDANDNTIYPQSTTSAVVDSDGVNLDVIHSKFITAKDVEEIEDVDTSYETIANRVMTINADATNTTYPTAAAVYNFFTENKDVGLTLKVVTEKPTVDIDTKTIYLIKKADTSIEENIYEEWIHTGEAWEKIGDTTTTIDLSAYYTQEEVDAKLINYSTTTTTDEKYAKLSLYGDTVINIGRKANTTTGDFSSVIGITGTATGYASFSEGVQTTAYGTGAHAEGAYTIANNNFTHAEGCSTLALADYSHTEGQGTQANKNHSHVQGKFNVIDENSEFLHIVGNGITEDARSNAHTIKENGDAWFSGDVYIKSTSGTNQDSGSKKLATEEYVDNLISSSEGDSSSGSASINNVEVGQIVLVNGELNDPRFLPCDGRILDIDYFPEIADILPRTWSDPVAYTSTLSTSCTKLFWAYDKLWACGTVGNTGSNPLYYSEDYGKTWLTADLSPLTNTATHNLGYSNGCMVLTPTAAATLASVTTCFYSFDGINWNAINLSGAYTESTDETTYVRTFRGYWKDSLLFTLRENYYISLYSISLGTTVQGSATSTGATWNGGIYQHNLLEDVAMYTQAYSSDGVLFYLADNSVKSYSISKSDATYSLLVLDGKYMSTSRGESGTTIGNWIYGATKAYPTQTDFLNNTNSVTTTNNPNNYVKLPNGDYCSLSATTFSYYKPKRYKLPTASTNLGINLNEYIKVSSTGDYTFPYKIYKGHFIPAFENGDFDASGTGIKGNITITHTLPADATLVVDCTDSYKAFDHKSDTIFDYSGGNEGDILQHTILVDLGEKIVLRKLFIAFEGLYGGTATISTSADNITYTNIYNNTEISSLYSVSTFSSSTEFDMILNTPKEIQYIKMDFKGNNKTYANVALREFDIIEWAKKEA